MRDKNKLALSEIFGKTIFRIPDYQRGYAWQIMQLNDFWEDLINLDIKHKHYTGLLSLKEATNEEIEKIDENEKYLINQKHFNYYFIVDGQQRLTTSLILLEAIITLISSLPDNQNKNDKAIELEDGEPLSEIKKHYICYPAGNFSVVYLFGYAKNNPNTDYLEYKIFRKECSGSVEESFYTKNLQNAQTFYKDKIDGYYKQYGIEGILKLYNLLTNNFIFYIQYIDDDYDVCVAFETMNNRGKALSNLELLKNRLIYLTSLYKEQTFGENPAGNRSALRNSINKAWIEVYKQLGRNSSHLLSDDEFLRAHWIMYYTYSRKKGNDYKDFLLNKFSYRAIYENISETTEINSSDQEIIYPERMIDQTEEEYNYDKEKVIDNISKITPEDIKTYVESLQEMAQYWFYSYYPEVNTNLSEEEINSIKRLNYIGINYFRPLIAVAIKDNRSSSEEKLKFYKAIERFIFVNFRMAQYFSNYKSSEFYRITKDLYYKKTTIKKITEDLEYYTNDNLMDARTRFESKITRLFENGTGFYGWSGLKYFLYIYEEHLSKKKERKINWNNLQNKDSIEHILPQEYSKNPYWKKMYNNFNENQINSLQSSLGNFLVLSKPANSALKNYDYQTKKNKVYHEGSYSEIKVSTENPDWCAENIYKRGLELMNFMNNTYNLNIDEETKKKLLHLDFLKEKATTNGVSTNNQD